jgi:hypothetical protein
MLVIDFRSGSEQTLEIGAVLERPERLLARGRGA